MTDPYRSPARHSIGRRGTGREARGLASGYASHGRPAIRIVALALLASIAAPLTAAERNVSVGSFERVRLDAPVKVTLVTGVSPTLRVTGEESAFDMLDIRQDGATVSIRRRAGRWQERPAAATAAPLTIALGTGAVSSITVIGGGDVTADRLKGARVDVSVSGPGRLKVGAVDADQAHVMLVGGGAITIGGGRSRTARLLANGEGAITADRFEAGDLSVSLDGPGEIRAHARFTASVGNSGTGSVTVAGNAKCRIRPQGGGAVRCGAAG